MTSTIWSSDWMPVSPPTNNLLSEWAVDWEKENQRLPVVLAFLGSSTDGVPPFEARDLDMMSSKLEQLLQVDGRQIDLILRVRGGNIPATVDAVGRILAFDAADVRAFVVDWATSAGTLLAMSCGEIVMDRFAYLGPCVPQAMQIPDVGGIVGVDHVEALDPVLRSNGELLRQPSLLVSLARSAQWRNEIDILLDHIAIRRKWSAEDRLKVQDLVLNSARPHDARLHAAAFGSDNSLAFRSPVGSERTLLDDLHGILHDRALGRQQDTAPLAIFGVQQQFSVKVASRTGREGADA